MFLGETPGNGCMELFFSRTERSGLALSSISIGRVQRTVLTTVSVGSVVRLAEGAQTWIGDRLSVPSEKIPQPPKIYSNFREVPIMFKAQ